MLRIWAAMPSSGRAMSVILPLAGLGEPLFEQGTFGGVASEAERLFIGAARLGGVAELAQQLRAGGVKQVVGTQGAGQGVQVGQRSGGARDLTVGYCPGQGGPRRGQGGRGGGVRAPGLRPTP